MLVKNTQRHQISTSGSRLNVLPDEIYQKVLGNIFTPVSELEATYLDKNSGLKLWNTKIWTTRCYKCHRHSSEVSLSHVCHVCQDDDQSENTKTTKVCDNRLICWDCAH